MNEYVIETMQATKSYGTLLALDHVNIHVKKGIIYGLVGDNGAGKSTLLKLLAGQVYATEGGVQLFGQSQEGQLEKCRRKMGCMIESPGFYPNMTVAQMLKYYSIQKGVPSSRKVQEMMQMAGIVQKATCKCKNLSLGQKQRLGIAVAMIGEPQLLILDEPINGLDPTGIIEFRALMHRLNQEKNITILMSSHILSELEQLADMYGFMCGGRLAEEITARALLEKCSDCIEIIVSDVEAFAASLDKHFPNETYQVYPENKVRITKPQAEAEVYSRLAAGAGTYITGMQVLKTSLEDYYMDLKERGSHR